MLTYAYYLNFFSLAYVIIFSQLLISTTQIIKLCINHLFKQILVCQTDYSSNTYLRSPNQTESQQFIGITPEQQGISLIPIPPNNL